MTHPICKARLLYSITFKAYFFPPMSLSLKMYSCVPSKFFKKMLRNSLIAKLKTPAITINPYGKISSGRCMNPIFSITRTPRLFVSILEISWRFRGRDFGLLKFKLVSPKNKATSPEKKNRVESKIGIQLRFVGNRKTTSY